MRTNIPEKKNPYAGGKAFSGAAITLGAEGSNVIRVTAQLQDRNGKSVGQRCRVQFFLSDDANGDSLTADANTSAPAIGVNGVLLGVTVTGKMWDVVTEATGIVDFDLTYTTGAKVYYLIAIAPDGSLIPCGAVTFAA